MRDLRLRPNRPAHIRSAGGDQLASGAVEPALIAKALDALARHSLYAREEELRQGFFTLEGGSRVGVCGRFATEDGHARALTHIGSICIRIAREVPGCADGIMPALLKRGASRSALILSPPGLGKTTLLRDIARQLSTGGAHAPPVNVAVCDERGELVACVSGTPTLDIGPRTDVLDGCPKREGLPLLIRSMAPDVVITDELGDAGDARAVREAARCGVRVIASAHAADLPGARARTALRQALDEKLFERIIVLSGGVGQIQSIMDADGRPIEM